MVKCLVILEFGKVGAYDFDSILPGFEISASWSEHLQVSFLICSLCVSLCVLLTLYFRAVVLILFMINENT